MVAVGMNEGVLALLRTNSGVGEGRAYGDEERVKAVGNLECFL